MRRFAVALGFLLLACTRLNPAFDDLDELGDDESDDEATGDGDGDSGGDGDGDPGDGDGDGEPGDGDGDPGDGDGDPGDGDGDPGDGDGEPGDGDGEPVDACAGVLLDEPYEAATTFGALIVDVSNAQGFASHAADCQVLTICVADQPVCDGASPFLARVYSNSLSVPGNAIPLEPTRIRLRFTPGKPSCGMPPLMFDPSQSIEIKWVTNNLQQMVPVRLPCFVGTDLELWVGEDGSSFYDAELMHGAALW